MVAGSRFVGLMFVLVSTPLLADTSDTQAFLCELAQRDAAITEEEFKNRVMEWIACTNQDEGEQLNRRGGCSAVTTRWGTRIECTASHEYRDDGPECPEHPRKLRKRMESAPERVKEYCTED